MPIQYMYCTVYNHIHVFFLCRSKLVIKQNQNLSACEERSLVLQFFVVWHIWNILHILYDFQTHIILQQTYAKNMSTIKKQSLSLETTLTLHTICYEYRSCTCKLILNVYSNIPICYSIGIEKHCTTSFFIHTAFKLMNSILMKLYFFLHFCFLEIDMSVFAKSAPFLIKITYSYIPHVIKTPFLF